MVNLISRRAFPLDKLNDASRVLHTFQKMGLDLSLAGSGTPIIDLVRQLNDPSLDIARGLKILLKLGASVEAKGYKGKIALWEVLEVSIGHNLPSCPPDSNAILSGRRGWENCKKSMISVLQDRAYVWENSEKTLILLLQHGACVGVRNEAGMTPIEWVCSRFASCTPCNDRCECKFGARLLEIMIEYADPANPAHTPELFRQGEEFVRNCARSGVFVPRGSPVRVLDCSRERTKSVVKV
jgi:hypothetical protein